MAKEFFIVDNVCSANKYLLTPLVVGEIVQKIEDCESDFSEVKSFMKVYHNGGNDISSFHNQYFKLYTPKDKIEMVNLIKNKGRLSS